MKRTLILAGIFVLATTFSTYWTSPAVAACTDNDVDGYGNPASPDCTYPDLDCDDSNPDINPGSFALISPPNGMILSSPPTFEWNPGCYDRFKFYSYFCYWQTYLSVYRSYSFWPPAGTTSLPMPRTWWNPLHPGYPNYWAVLGVNTTTQAWQIVGAWTFKKLQ